MFGAGARREQEKQWRLPHTHADGSVGVGAMKVCKANGEDMSKEEIANAVISHGGKDYYPDPKTGVLRNVDTSLLQSFSQGIQHEQYL